MEDLPPEISPHRQAIYDKVVGVGRMRRRRRLAAAVVVIAAIVAVPVAAIALVQTESDHPRVVATSPSTTEATETTAPETTATTASSSAPTTTPETTAPETTAPETNGPGPTAPETPVDAPAVEPVPGLDPTTTTTALVCRNSMDPACGDLYYDPPITNAPAHMVVTAAPAHPAVGDKVTFTFHVTDPDTRFDGGSQASDWCDGSGQRAGYSFGDGEDPPQICPIGDCFPSGFGPWDPPAPQPSAVTLTLEHTYTRAGTYSAKFTLKGGFCSARPGYATTTISITVAA